MNKFIFGTNLFLITAHKLVQFVWAVIVLYIDKAKVYFDPITIFSIKKKLLFKSIKKNDQYKKIFKKNLKIFYYLFFSVNFLSLLIF